MNKSDLAKVAMLEKVKQKLHKSFREKLRTCGLAKNIDDFPALTEHEIREILDKLKAEVDDDDN